MGLTAHRQRIACIPEYVPLYTKSMLTSWRIKHQARLADDGLVFLMTPKKDINFSFAAHSENCLDNAEKPCLCFLLVSVRTCMCTCVRAHLCNWICMCLNQKKPCPVVKEIKNKLKYASICQCRGSRDLIINLHI